MLQLFRVEIIGLGQAEGLEVGAVSDERLDLPAGAEEVAATGGFPAGPAGGELVGVGVGVVVLAGADFIVMFVVGFIGTLVLAVGVAAAEGGGLVRVVVVCCGGKARRGEEERRPGPPTGDARQRCVEQRRGGRG